MITRKLVPIFVKSMPHPLVTRFGHSAVVHFNQTVCEIIFRNLQPC